MGRILTMWPWLPYVRTIYPMQIHFMKHRSSRIGTHLIVPPIVYHRDKLSENGWYFDQPHRLPQKCQPAVDCAMFEFVAFAVARRDGVVVQRMRFTNRPARVLTFILGLSLEHQLETGCKTEIF